MTNRKSELETSDYRRAFGGGGIGETRTSGSSKCIRNLLEPKVGGHSAEWPFGPQSKFSRFAYDLTVCITFRGYKST